MEPEQHFTSVVAVHMFGIGEIPACVKPFEGVYQAIIERQVFCPDGLWVAACQMNALMMVRVDSMTFYEGAELTSRGI